MRSETLQKLNYYSMSLDVGSLALGVILAAVVWVRVTTSGLWAYSLQVSVRAIGNRRGLTNTVVSLIIAGIVFAIMFPIAMTQVISANTSGWNSSVIVLFVTLFPVLLIIGVVLHLTGRL